MQVEECVDAAAHVKEQAHDVDWNKVLVVGLGQIGFPVAKYVKEKGFEVYGYDINQKAMEDAKVFGIKQSSNFGGFGVYILCVPTHRTDDIFKPQIESLLSVVRKIGTEANSGSLISIESTIPRGTSRKVFELINQRLHVAHVPHRWYASEQEFHGVNQLRVAGGVRDCCLRLAAKFYNGFNAGVISDRTRPLTPLNPAKSAEKSSMGGRILPSLGISLHAVPDIDVAEATKVTENAHRFLQIAFAEELYLYCRANHIDFFELRDALNSKWNVEVLEPREGIGGHCLPKDTQIFLQSSSSKILNAAVKVDQDYRNSRK